MERRAEDHVSDLVRQHASERATHLDVGKSLAARGHHPAIRRTSVEERRNRLIGGPDRLLRLQADVKTHGAEREATPGRGRRQRTPLDERRQLDLLDRWMVA